MAKPNQLNFRTALCFAVCGSLASPAFAGLPLETESAYLPAKGHGLFEFAYEYQTSSEGKESALPFVFDYGLTDRLMVTIEPVAAVSIRPKVGPSASGFGDTEVALTYLVAPETESRPAFAVAGEIKFPTANDPLIGTGKTDYRLYGIVSKTVGKYSFSGNLGYTFVGSPSGTSLGNAVDYAISAQYAATDRLTLCAEFIGNTSSQGGAEVVAPTAPPLTAEAAGNEQVGLLGFSYLASKNISLSLGVTYDNNSATLLRTGLEYRF